MTRTPQQDKLLAIAGLVNAYHNDGTTLSAGETLRAIADVLGPAMAGATPEAASLRAQIEQLQKHSVYHYGHQTCVLLKDVLALLDAPVAQCGVHAYTPDVEGICTGCGGREHWGHQSEVTHP